jgi:uncharacterized protein YdcH (DUF465 family)
MIALGLLALVGCKPSGSSQTTVAANPSNTNSGLVINSSSLPMEATSQLELEEEIKLAEADLVLVIEDAKRASADLTSLGQEFLDSATKVSRDLLAAWGNIAKLRLERANSREKSLRELLDKLAKIKLDRIEERLEVKVERQLAELEARARDLSARVDEAKQKADEANARLETNASDSANEALERLKAARLRLKNALLRIEAKLGSNYPASLEIKVRTEIDKFESLLAGYYDIRIETLQNDLKALLEKIRVKLADEAKAFADKLRMEIDTASKTALELLAERAQIEIDKIAAKIRKFLEGLFK